MSAIEVSRASLARDPHERFLPSTEPEGYAVGGTESLAAALHRITTEQFTLAIDALSRPDADTTVTALETLDAIDRISAILRMVREVIGGAAYRTELTILRETGDRLRAVLDGHPEIVALDRIRSRYDRVLRPEAFEGLRTNLVQRHQLRRLHTLSDGNVLGDTLHSLRRARARFAAWPIEGDAARMYGREPIPDTFESVAPGLSKTYRRARRHWKHSRDGISDDIAVDWRRETRRLGHQLELLATTWPEVVGATATACGQLDGVLAEADEYTSLAHALAADQRLNPEPTERSLLDALVSGCIRELHAIARTLGARLYVEPADLFINRLGAYWDARDLTRG